MPPRAGNGNGVVSRTGRTSPGNGGSRNASSSSSRPAYHGSGHFAHANNPYVIQTSAQKALMAQHAAAHAAQQQAAQQQAAAQQQQQQAQQQQMLQAQQQAQAAAAAAEQAAIAGGPTSSSESHNVMIKSILDRGVALNSEAAREQGYSIQEKQATLPPVLQKLELESQDCTCQLGNMAQELNEWEKAHSLYHQILHRKNPFHLGALLGMVNYHKEKENHNRILDYAARYLALDENGAKNGQVWSIIGHSLLILGDLHKAYSCYQQAIAKTSQKDDPKLWYGIGILYDRYGSMEHAEEAFASVLKLEPNFYKRDEVYFRLGIIYKLQGKAEASLECFHYIIDSPPSPLKDVDVWYQIGHALELKRDFSAAREAYERVLRTTPDHSKVLQHLGGLYLRENTSFHNADKCITLITTSLEHDSHDPFSWYLLGRAFMQMENYGKAYEAYQQAVYRDGKNPAYWCSIGVLYFNINQYHDALDAYTRAVRIHPFIPEIWQNLGILYESCHDQLHDAQDAYQRALQLDGNNTVLSRRFNKIKDLVQSLAENGPPQENGAPVPPSALLNSPPPIPMDIMPDTKSWSSIHFSLTGAKPVYLDSRSLTGAEGGVPLPPDAEMGSAHGDPRFPHPDATQLEHPRRVSMNASNNRPHSATYANYPPPPPIQHPPTASQPSHHHHHHHHASDRSRHPPLPGMQDSHPASRSHAEVDSRTAPRATGAVKYEGGRLSPASQLQREREEQAYLAARHGGGAISPVESPRSAAARVAAAGAGVPHHHHHHHHATAGPSGAIPPEYVGEYSAHSRPPYASSSTAGMPPEGMSPSQAEYERMRARERDARSNGKSVAAPLHSPPVPSSGHHHHHHHHRQSASASNPPASAPYPADAARRPVSPPLSAVAAQQRYDERNGAPHSASGLQPRSTNGVRGGPPMSYPYDYYPPNVGSGAGLPSHYAPRYPPGDPRNESERAGMVDGRRMPYEEEERRMREYEMSRRERSPINTAHPVHGLIDARAPPRISTNAPSNGAPPHSATVQTPSSARGGAGKGRRSFGDDHAVGPSSQGAGQPPSATPAGAPKERKRKVAGSAVLDSGRRAAPTTGRVVSRGMTPSGPPGEGGPEEYGEEADMANALMAFAGAAFTKDGAAAAAGGASAGGGSKRPLSEIEDSANPNKKPRSNEQSEKPQ